MLWKNQALSISQGGDINDICDILVKNTINCNPTHSEQTKNKILEIYFRNLEYYGPNLSFEDILTDIWDYNNEIFFDMGLRELHMHFDVATMSDDSQIETVHGLADEWADYYNYGYHFNLEATVFDAISEIGAFIVVPNTFNIYATVSEESETVMVLNDCQGTLFPEMETLIKKKVIDATNMPLERTNIKFWGKCHYEQQASGY